MKQLIAIALLALTSAATAGAENANPRVALETSKGRIVLELYPDKTPATVENFLAYVESGFYDGTIFHRARPGFMIQGGGYTADLKEKPTRERIQNEADMGVGNARGTLAMARKNDPHSASAQFFINVVDNEYLNHVSKTPSGWGYTAFGKVVEGMEVADAIAAVATRRTRLSEGQPVEPITIDKASVVEPEPESE